MTSASETVESILNLTKQIESFHAYLKFTYDWPQRLTEEVEIKFKKPHKLAFRFFKKKHAVNEEIIIDEGKAWKGYPQEGHYRRQESAHLGVSIPIDPETLLLEHLQDCEIDLQEQDLDVWYLYLRPKHRKRVLSPSPISLFPLYSLASHFGFEQAMVQISKITGFPVKMSLVCASRKVDILVKQVTLNDVKEAEFAPLLKKELIEEKLDISQFQWSDLERQLSFPIRYPTYLPEGYKLHEVTITSIKENQDTQIQRLFISYRKTPLAASNPFPAHFHIDIGPDVDIEIFKTRGESIDLNGIEASVWEVPSLIESDPTPFAVVWQREGVCYLLTSKLDYEQTLKVARSMIER